MAPPRLTHDGILLICESLREIQANEPRLVVVLTRKLSTPSQCTIRDGKRQVGAHLSSKAMRALGLTRTSAFIQINQFVVSRETTKLFVGLADIKFLAPAPKNVTASKPGRYSPPAPQRIQGGRCPSFLQEVAPHLDLDTLAGKINQEHLKSLDEFMERHAAMETLHRGDDTRNVHSETYVRAMELFQASQLDRQTASLTKNAGKQDAEKAKMLQTQHRSALQEALGDRGAVTPQRIQAWHKTMLDGILNQAGRWRSKGVKVGKVNFMPHSQVRGDIDIACDFLQSFDAFSSSSNSQIARLVKAAVALFVIVDVHPFADGNGRISRIAANWALELPFCIHLFATETQRADLIQAIALVRRNTSLVVRGVSEQQDSDAVLATAMEELGGFQPLVALILDRIVKALDEFQRVHRDQIRLATERQDVLHQQRFRQEAAQSNCLICFEPNCNIATLCCGKAIHLNCMAEWLSQGYGTCPQCRAQLPSLPPRLQRPSSNEETSTETIETDESSTAEDEVDMLDSSSTTEEDDVPVDTETTEDDSDTETVEMVQISVEQEEDNAETTETVEEDAQDDASSSTALEENDTEADTTDDFDTSSSSEPAEAAPLPGFCEYVGCNNRAARDCENNCCGSCCLMYGQWGCERHQ